MERESAHGALPKNLQFRVGLLLGLVLVIAVGFVLYALYARGIFEHTQRLTLVAENADGVSIGMDLSFSGFPIGRVRRMALGEDGRARIEIDVPTREAHWLRTSSIFTIERGLVGAARIRAYTGNLQDPPLADGAVRQVLRGDTTEEIPRMVATLRSVLENVEQLTASGGSLQASLENVRALTERLGGRQGALAALLGSESDARKVVLAIDRANQLLASLGGIASKLDPIVDDTTRAVAQANAILGDVRESLKKADQILADAQAVASNAKAASTDLAALRAEVDASLHKVAGLIDDINRKWPFRRDTEIRLP